MSISRRRFAAMALLTIASLFAATLVANTLPAHAQTVLVPAGSTWHYLDDGSDQGTAWRAPDFDDSVWDAGPAQLGFGDDDEATVLSFGSDPEWKHITTYFRIAFELPELPSEPWLVLRLVRDDGAAIYLNGEELLRSNMSPGEIDFETLGASRVRYYEEDHFYGTIVSADLLEVGTNILAVEVHQWARDSSDLGFDLALETGTGGLPFVRKPPYLILPEETAAVQILWQTAIPGDCTFEWGLDEIYDLGTLQTQALNDDLQHTQILTDLLPGQRYFYRVSFSGESYPGSFLGPPDPDATSLKFMVYGDSRYETELHDSVANSMLESIAADPGYAALLISTGDLVFEGNDETDWDEQHLGTGLPHIAQLLAGSPFQASRGNHESDALLYAKYLPYPFVGERYWSFDLGPAHFIVLDQYADYDSGSAQLTWLENDLAETEKPWRFLVLHWPGWTSGYHDNLVQVQELIHPLCVQYGVAIVFGGHNHCYVRAMVEDVQHVTTGGGGAGLHIPDPEAPYVVASASLLHFCRVEISNNELRFEAVAGDSVIDAILLEPPTAVTLPAPEARGSAQLSAHPNPFNPRTVVHFAVPVAGHVELDAYDSSGRHSGRLLYEQVTIGSQSMIWDGTDAAGHPLPSGLYVLRLTGEGFEPVSRKVVLLR